ncbi:MAG: hypothetical protein FJY82_08600 [Candidatus Aminicenantes bacterium]|nr:hypothetical protein [Candidatus Aminicenantes bacterium]
MTRSILASYLAVLVGGAAWAAASRSPSPATRPEAAAAAEISLRRDDKAGRLAVLIGGREAFAYQYAAALDLPHYWPLNSPGGRNMLVQRAEPYPHHRSFWFADTVRIEGGREVSLYNAYYSGREVESGKRYEPPFRDRIRHLEFSRLDAGGARALIEARLAWETDEAGPLLEERRTMTVQALGGGEYFLDLVFELRVLVEALEFRSDEVHYAWPYLRLEKRWSGESGGKIMNDAGAEGEKATNMQVAKWIDYSNTVDAETAGVAVFQYPDWANHRWLTREYGCFGPRRPDGVSGKPFLLLKGGTVRQRVGVLVHKGDANGGKVAERYEAYIKNRPPR